MTKQLLLFIACSVAGLCTGQQLTFDNTTAVVTSSTPITGPMNVNCTSGVLFAASNKEPTPKELGWMIVPESKQGQIPLMVKLAAPGRKLFVAHINETFLGATPALASADPQAKFFVAPEPPMDEGEVKADDPDALAQAVLDRQDSIEKRTGGYVQFALSVGWRHITDGGDANSLYDAGIDPADSTLHLDRRNRGAFLLSGVVAVYPWVKKKEGEYGHGINWLGFVANVNLAEFTNGTAQATFNKKIEGGYGVAFRFSSHFSLAITYEKVFSRRPREWVIEKEGEQIHGSDGNVVASIDQNDPNLFIEDNFNAISVKMVYRLK